MTVISSWALEQLAPWMLKPSPSKDCFTELRNIHRFDPDVFFFEINRGRVTVDYDKPHDGRPWADDTRPRCELYARWFELVTQHLCPDLQIELALCVGDSAVSDASLPVFAFQKPKGNASILLPDVDLLRSGFDAAHDTIEYDSKDPHAIFVGSSSGGWITAERLIENGAIPRINAALFFRESTEVTFKIPIICQYDSDETGNILRSMGFGDNSRVGWPKMLENKFIFSMDGNGAACSRVLNTLQSNSVLMKYKSDHILYYFSGLRPWLHFIPIESFSDVIKFVQIEKSSQGFFKDLSRSSREFCSRYLTRGAAMKYTANVLQLYSGWIDGNVRKLT
jgi:hypothetical protein